MHDVDSRPLGAVRTAHSASPAPPVSSVTIESLEVRRLLSAVAPVSVGVSIGYREAPDGGTDRAHISWMDPNTTESGYRVEFSPDGISNWATVNGADLPP